MKLGEHLLLRPQTQVFVATASTHGHCPNAKTWASGNPVPPRRRPRCPAAVVARSRSWPTSMVTPFNGRICRRNKPYATWNAGFAVHLPPSGGRHELSRHHLYAFLKPLSCSLQATIFASLTQRSQRAMLSTTCPLGCGTSARSTVHIANFLGILNTVSPSLL